MSQVLNVGVEGLLTNNNLQTLPKGSLVDVSNMNVDRKLIEVRRGFSKHSTLADIKSITEYQDKLIARQDDNTVKYYSSGSWNSYAQTVAPPSSTVPVRFAQVNQNLYMTSSTGIKVLDAYNGTIYATGMPKGLDGIGATYTAGTFTAATSDICTKVGHGFFTGLKVQVSTTTTLPSPLTVSTDYFIIVIDSDTFYLATSYSNSLSGSRIDITTIGTGTHTITPSGSASGFMSNNTQVAYRVVWGTRDANDNLYLGAPSQRIIVANTSGGTRDVSLTFTVPSGITTSDFFQVYRSRESASATTEPDDELQLIYEANPTSGEISALSITFTDATDETLFGAALYTNANQEGISETNDNPPFATDIAEFKGFTFFSNIKTRHQIYINLLAVGGSGLVVNDTITINSMVFTAKAATTVASREFKVFTSGTAAQNIEDTAKELVKVVNQYTGNTSVYAYYTSEYSELPGQILIEERSLSSSAFTVSVSRAVAWRLDNSGTSSNNEYVNGLAWSKAQQPEHVPSSHLQLIGSKSYQILRILSLQDSLFILKEDGIFRLTGDNGNWSIDAFDNSTILLAPESAVVLNNQIYCLSNQGVVTISTVGVNVIGEDIKDSIQEIMGSDFTNVKNTTFGVAYNTDRKYILSIIETSGSVIPSQQFVLNVFTNKWSRWTRTAVCGFVAPSNDKLYLATETTLAEERKDRNYTDYADEEILAVNIASYTTTSVQLDSVTGVSVGDLLWQSSSLYSAIVAVDEATNIVTVTDEIVWSIAAASILSGITASVEWAPAYCDNGGLEKHFQQLQLMFKENSFQLGTLEFYTDINGGFESVTVNGDYGGGSWGLFPWGSIPWGGETRPTPIRVSVPRNKTRGQLLGIKFSCRMAYAKFAIEGYSLQFDYISERQGDRNV